MDDRPAIWIGKFYLNEDKVVYICSWWDKLPKSSVRLQKRQKKFANGEKVVDDLIEKIPNTVNIKSSIIDNQVR